MQEFFNDPFFRHGSAFGSGLHLSEEKNEYIVEAALPGVKKENLDVRVGDGGRNVIIEGKVFRRRGPEQQLTEGMYMLSPNDMIWY